MPDTVKGSVPLYAQLETALRESLRRGLWGPGDPIPSDRELAAQWRVSRCTVRQAVDALVRDGLVERQQGRGTFVVTSEVLRDFIGYYTFGGPEEEPVRLSSRILSFDLVDPPRWAVEHLRTRPGVRTLRLRLLRLANEEPALLLTSYLRPEECSGLQAEDFLAFPALTEALTKRCGVPVVSQHRTVRPTLLAGEEAELLAARPGALGMVMERVSYTENRRPVECGSTLVRGDRCAYVLDIRRAGDRSGRGVHGPDGLWLPASGPGVR